MNLLLRISVPNLHALASGKHCNTVVFNLEKTGLLNGCVLILQAMCICMQP